MLGFDTETTGLKVYDGTDHIIGFSIAVKLSTGAVVGEYFPINHRHGGNLPEEVWRPLLELIITKILIIHNAVFDLTALKNLGINAHRFICTMKYAHLLNENKIGYSLDQVSADFTGSSTKVKDPLFEMGLLAYGWDMPANLIRKYGAEDSIGLIHVMDRMLERTEKQNEVGLTKFWTKYEAPSTVGLVHMRAWGVEVDLETCRREEMKGLEEKERIKDHFGFNPGSSDGLKRLLIDELGLPILAESAKTGKPSFTKKEMERYDLMLNPIDFETGKPKERTEGSDIVRELLVYRGWEKAVSGYYQSYQKHVSPDGRLRPEYKTNGTVTGRYSCE